MRLLLASNGSLGDLYPALGLGQAVKDAGHEVAVITTGNFEEAVREASLDFVELADAAAYEVMRESFESYMAEGHKVWAPKEFPPIFLELPRLLYEAFEKHQGPDTVIGSMEYFTYGGGAMAGEALGLPYASIWHNVVQFRTVQPVLPPRFSKLEYSVASRIYRLFPPMAKLNSGLEDMRRSLGLRRKSLVEAIYHSQDLNLCLFPQWYVAWFHGRMHNTVLTDFPRYERVLDHGLSPELEQFLAAGSPPVVFSTASWRADRKGYFQAALNACEQLNLRAIFQGTDALPFGEQSDRVFAAGSLPYTTLLPKTAAIVHHGGIGTVASGLAAGIPQLVVSIGNDTPYNGRKLGRLGVGMTIKNARYEREIADTLQTLLASQQIKQRAHEIARQFTEPPNLQPAVYALEALAASASTRRARTP